MSASVADLDHRHLWHPFTQQRGWEAEDPIVIESAEGTDLIAADGSRYIDGTSSLWCNLHGHRHPVIDAAIRAQLDRVAHSTMLGLTHAPAAELAARLVAIAPPGLNRVFYSDAGSTATEIALKMAFQYWRQRGGQHARRTSFIGLDDGYHGDTIGAVSVGGIDLFHGAYEPLLFAKRSVPAGDPCALLEALERYGEETAAVIVEPLVQGAGGILVQPAGYLRAVRELCDQHDVLLICDEVATGFGRTGTMFACEQERVSPDFLCLGKGLTNGYMPLAATLTTDRVYEGFLGEHEEFRTFFHGHTFTGNPLACSAAIASLDVFERGGDPAPPAAEDQPAQRAPGRRRRHGRGVRGPGPGDHGRDRSRRARSGAATRPPGHARGPQARGHRPPARRHHRPGSAAGDQQARHRPARLDHRGVDP